MARAIKLIDAPIGLFEVDGILVLKTEYSTRHEDGTITPDCYIIESGEYFWGGVDSVEERNNLEVAPVDMPTLTPPNEPPLLEFDVVDTTTGKYPDWERIAREESWAKGLVYCDMDGIAIREDGSLILLDECGNCVSCPPDRFEIRRRPLEGEEDT